jgi:hypothetical protein
VETASSSFAQLLLQIGDGRLPVSSFPDTIAIPANLGKCVEKLEDLKAAIFPDMQANSRSPDWLSERALLSPLNVNVNRLNNNLLKEFPGELQQFKSVDTAVCPLSCGIPQLLGSAWFATPHPQSKSRLPHHHPQIPSSP